MTESCVHNALSRVKSKRTRDAVHFARMTFDDRPDPAKRLEQARVARGFSSGRAAAEYFGWNPYTYAQHESGLRGITRGAKRYAAALGVSEAWLLTGEGDELVVSVPLISWVSAGGLRRQEGVTSAEIDRYVPVANLPKGDWIALTVAGDSMNRIAPEGAIIIVNHSEDTLVNDRFYVFALETGEATFKRWRATPEPMLQPYSTNLDHLSIPAKGREFYVLGRVRRVITDI